MLVSLCKCWMFVSDVHPFAILSAMFNVFTFIQSFHFGSMTSSLVMSFISPGVIFLASAKSSYAEQFSVYSFPTLCESNLIFSWMSSAVDWI